jgi:hypothetical protein
MFYAAQSPRGFSNEVIVYSFSTKSRRDVWVLDHENDGDVNSAYRGGYAITRAAALRIAGMSEQGDGKIAARFVA